MNLPDCEVCFSVFCYIKRSSVLSHPFSPGLPLQPCFVHPSLIPPLPIPSVRALRRGFPSVNVFTLSFFSAYSCSTCPALSPSLSLPLRTSQFQSPSPYSSRFPSGQFFHSVKVLLTGTSLFKASVPSPHFH